MKNKTSLIFAALLMLIKVNAQEFIKVDVEDWRYEEFSFPQKAYFVDESLFLEGVDHTDILQDVFNQHKIIVLPKIKININYVGVNLKEGTQLYFQKGSILKMIPNDKEKYSIININKVENVSVYNAQLVGDRELHKGNNGEWGMGLSIRSSENINIYNSYIKNTWGDGIYIGKAGSTKAINNKILVKGGIIDFTRRNGISITSGKDIKIEAVSIYNIYGTKPMEGIDIEPNKNSIAIGNITLKDIKTYNNAFAGIAVALDHLRHLNEKETAINIENHQDIGSKYGLRIGYVRHVDGIVKVSNSNWRDNEAPLYFSNIWVSDLKVEFLNSYKNEATPITKSLVEKDLKRIRPNSNIRLKNYRFIYSK